jgi:hypothetical protein
MKKTSVTLIAFCMFIFGTTIRAQNAVPASGGNASGAGGTLSFTVGQVVYSTYIGTNGSVAQGVQQPYEISVVTGLEESGINLNLSAYPNPATDYLILRVENYEVGNLRYQLYDINGNILLSNNVEGNETNISMQNFLPATYFLKVTDKNKEIKVFKIIKK